MQETRCDPPHAVVLYENCRATIDQMDSEIAAVYVLRAASFANCRSWLHRRRESFASVCRRFSEASSKRLKTRSKLSSD